MWSDAGIGERVLMGAMALLVLFIVAATLWLLLAPLWDGLRSRRAEILRQRRRAASREARFRRRNVG